MSELAVVRLGVDFPYEQAWDLQRRIHARRVAGEAPDTCLMLEHAPVYTAGRRTAPHERPGDGTPVIDVDRGGRITWHGPGQLVCYPIVRLHERLDVVTYIGLLEESLIKVCADFGVQAGRVSGRSGVWVPGDPSHGLPDRQVGAVGIRVAGGVTMHGYALNCSNDPSWYNRIVPCGFADAGVSSLSAETGRRIVVDDVMPYAEKRLAEALGVESRDLPEEDLFRR
ncbi:lipoyl(octanoyl) transferase LipB [Planomonospora parontospora]|uniref:lipoyl(octanoyl) transferase LipB n=1 Tax=Planomonospora parontospora TaxID=58119 RepID=UPI0019B92687|nr:lipoyl(octanoyl) transferase LipB [Planomonospora parontospora]GGL04069.1 octanoyltransferase [Planomonospora parontospora subsp. antibiotica]GII13435.1 octanoyltransferase [Planomonospora parontospora subsp. antibiotica]